MVFPHPVVPPPEVFIDGESVTFSGPLPEDVANLIAAVEPALAKAGRVLSAVTIDGRAAGDEVSKAEYAVAARVELSSIPVDQAVTRVAGACLELVCQAAASADTLASEVLRVRWSGIQPRCADLAEALGKAAREFAGVAGHVPGGTEALASLVQGMDRWIDALHGADAARVCLVLNDVVIPALGAIEAAIRAGRTEETV